jgi:hypothetical protein
MRTSVAALTVAGVINFACASQMPPAAPSAPAPATPAPAARTDLTGTWSGTGSDSFSAERVMWVLAQSGSNVTGTAELAPVDPRDGSCASCHKLRKGTFSGIFDGATLLTVRMSFPAGGDVPTPICVTDLSGTAALAGNQLTGTYSGTDTCEGFYANGQLTLTKQP